MNCINKVIYYPEGLRWTLHAIAIITWTSLAGNIRSLPRVCTLGLSREVLADTRSQLCLDWYLGLEVSKAQSPTMMEKGWVSALK